jgi:hypothetical protein
LFLSEEDQEIFAAFLPSFLLLLMGNCLSHSNEYERLEGLEEKYGAVSSLLAAREQELRASQQQSEQALAELSGVLASFKQLQD